MVAGVQAEVEAFEEEERAFQRDFPDYKKEDQIFYGGRKRVEDNPIAGLGERKNDQQGGGHDFASLDHSYFGKDSERRKKETDLTRKRNASEQHRHATERRDLENQPFQNEGIWNFQN